MREISFNEMEEVVKEMPNNKALGLDGFIIDFFKAHGPFIGKKCMP